MGSANYIRKLLIKIKSHINMNTLTVGHLNTPLSEIDNQRKTKKKQEH